MPRRILVTGGFGFIGSAYVKRRVAAGDDLLIVDSNTYAGDETRLLSVKDGYETRTIDIASDDFIDFVKKEKPDLLVHFAAETHVTRSEIDPEAFFHTNVLGTRNVLNAVATLSSCLLAHISTDEVYGPCHGEPFREGDKAPGEGKATSAYARSKAVGDDLVRSFSDSIDLVVIRPTNCFGPWQHPEKAIARWMTRLAQGQRIPVWGDGQQVRDWMFVDDACAGIDRIIEKGQLGKTYNLAPESGPFTNLEIARMAAAAAGKEESAVYLTAYDRPQHDRRYAVDASRVKALGWTVERDLKARLEETWEWYWTHQGWWSAHLRQSEALYEDAQRRGS